MYERTRIGDTALDARPDQRIIVEANEARMRVNADQAQRENLLEIKPEFVEALMALPINCKYSFTKLILFSLIATKGRSTVLTDIARRVARVPTRKRLYNVAFKIEDDNEFNIATIPFSRIRTTELDSINTQLNRLTVESHDP